MHDPVALGLMALGWIAADADRLQRFTALTGLDGDTLRARADDPALLAAAIGFLEAHEPDLVACAGSLGVSPAALLTARQALDA